MATNSKTKKADPKPQTEAQTEPAVLTVVAPYGLNLRRTPSFHSAVLEVLKDGQTLDVRPVEEEIPAGWKPVKAGDRDGWVYGRYVKE